MVENCPYTETCPFYQNWVRLGHLKRRDVVVATGSQKIGITYNCLALVELEKPRKGILSQEAALALFDSREISCRLNELGPADSLAQRINALIGAKEYLGFSA